MEAEVLAADVSTASQLFLFCGRDGFHQSGVSIKAALHQVHPFFSLWNFSHLIRADSADNARLAAKDARLDYNGRSCKPAGRRSIEIIMRLLIVTAS